MTLSGFAAPLEIAAATVSLAAKRTSVSKVSGKLGEAAFTGSYEARGSQPARFTLAIAEATAADLDRVFAPTLSRAAPGLIDRTLRRPANAPEWLKLRRAEGTLTIDSATAAEWRARDIKTRVVWDGVQVHFTNATAQIEGASFAGSLDVDLAEPSAKLHLTGAITGVPYRGGALDLTGSVDAEGSGAQLLQTARAEGTARGRAIAFAADADFRTLSGAFAMQPMGTTPRWRVTNVETPQGQGSGATQDDGQLVLTVGQTRFAGPLFPARIK